MNALLLKWAARLVPALALVVVALLLFSRWSDRRTSEAFGRAKADVTRLRADSVRNANTVRRVDSVYVAKLDTFVRREAHYYTLRDTVLQRLTDTVTVERFVRLADSTVLACREALASCAQRVAARDSLITTLGHQRDADRRLFAAKLRQATPRVVPWVAAGVDPFDPTVQIARAGLDVRVFGPLRLTGDVAYQTLATHHRAAFVGVRVAF